MVEALLAELAFVATFAAIYALLALGLNLQLGYTGLFNAGVAGFWATGAYAFALLVTTGAEASFAAGHAGLGLPWAVGLLGAVLAAALLGLAAALPALSLRADYLAIATLGVAEILRLLLVHGGDVTGGAFGIGGIPRPLEGLEPRQGDLAMALLALAALAAALLVLERTGRSPWGRVLKAVREDEEAAEALGKDVRAYKLQAFAIGCALMGLAGVLYASFLRTIEPRASFAPLDTFLTFVVVIVGGAGNHKGAVLGAVVVWGFFYGSLRLKDLLPSWLAEDVPYLRFVAIGVLLVLVVMFRPQGLWPEERAISTEA